MEDVLAEEIIKSNPEKGAKIVIDYDAEKDDMTVGTHRVHPNDDDK